MVDQARSTNTGSGGPVWGSGAWTPIRLGGRCRLWSLIDMKQLKDLHLTVLCYPQSVPIPWLGNFLMFLPWYFFWRREFKDSLSGYNFHFWVFWPYFFVFAFDDFEIFKHIHTFVKAWMSLKLCAGECDVIGGFLPFYFEKKQWLKDHILGRWLRGVRNE